MSNIRLIFGKKWSHFINFFALIPEVRQAARNSDVIFGTEMKSSFHWDNPMPLNSTQERNPSCGLSHVDWKFVQAMRFRLLNLDQMP